MKTTHLTQQTSPSEAAKASIGLFSFMLMVVCAVFLGFALLGAVIRLSTAAFDTVVNLSSMALGVIEVLLRSLV